MPITVQEKIKRKEAVDFVRNNSRLEGLTHDIPEINQLYQEYINGNINANELVKKTNIIMDNKLVKLQIAK